MRLSAVLMDAGAYLALDPIERRARKIRRRLMARKGSRLGPYRTLLAMNADDLAGEATLVLGRRATHSGRIHTLLCVATGDGSSTPEAARPSLRRSPPGVFDGEVPQVRPDAQGFYWAVRTQRADAPRGMAGARTSMLHEREGALEMALIAFFADPVPQSLAGLGRFDHHEPPGEGLTEGLTEGLSEVSEIEPPAA